MNFVLSSYVGQVPAILAYLIAIGVAAWLMNQYPRPAMLVMAGFGLLLALTFVLPLVQHILIQNAETRSRPTLFTLLGLASSVVRMLAYAALLIAAFVDRPSIPPRTGRTMA